MKTKSISKESTAKILVVDDDISVLTTLREILVGAGYGAETAQSTKKALDLLRSASRFDLIITDMKMPEMGGLELLRQSRPFRKGIPVIILTAYPKAEDVIQAIEEGACDYILKPCGVLQFVEAVKEALKSTVAQSCFN